MHVKVLGTAPPLKTLVAGQGGTSLLIRADDACLMVDCGPGAVNRLDASGVDVRQVTALLLTHHHWDHVADVPFLVLGRWEASQFGAGGGRPFADPLTVRGPRGTVRLFERDGQDFAVVALEKHYGKGSDVVLYEGPVGGAS